MSYATQPLSKRIAVVFDFDETLIPDDIALRASQKQDKISI